MKIVCDGCGAKYSIADEKVVGRVFKIRCKKCGAAIVVKGNAQTAGAAPVARSSGGFDYGGEAVWHAVVDGEQQGPFAPTQLGAMISGATIGWDAYVWREGFADWKPAQEIDELVQAIMSPAVLRDAGADLFAQSEASPFSGGGADEDDVVASTATPRAASSQPMTGARNENSVLFSLSNLQSLATTSHDSSAPSSAGRANAPSGTKQAMAAGDGSGLIDIRALASATGLSGNHELGAARAIGPAPAAKVEDLLSIGAPSVSLGSALGAPVIIAERSEPARGGGGMIGAAAIVAMALLGGAGIFAYVSLHRPDPAAASAPVAIALPTPPPSSIALTTPPIATAVATTTALTPPATTLPGTSVIRDGSRHPHSTAIVPRSTTTDPPPATRVSTTSSTPSSIDDLMARAVRPPSAEEHSTTPADPALPATPTTSDVRSAMTAIGPAVTACGAGEHGVATVQVVFAGATGRVSNTTVSGPFAGTPVGSCIARTVRGATLPHFRQTTFTVTYPFRI